MGAAGEVLGGCFLLDVTSLLTFREFFELVTAYSITYVLSRGRKGASGQSRD